MRRPRLSITDFNALGRIRRAVTEERVTVGPAASRRTVVQAVTARNKAG